jgi:hypothetical protein
MPGMWRSRKLVLRLTRTAGFHRTIELPTRPAEPWRSIDVAVSSVLRRIAIAVECWNSIGDLGGAIRSSHRKAVELAAVATARWADEGRSGLVWVMRATARNQELVARYPEVFRSAFPGSSRGWLRTLTTGAEPPMEPGLVWCDVGATRLYEWRRR